MTDASWKIFDQWFTAQYVGSRHLAGLEGGAPFRQLVGTIATTPAMASGMKRMRNFMRLRYRYPLQREGYTCASFSLVVDDAGGGTKAQGKPIQTTYAHCFYDHTGAAEYVSVSPTYDSKDGEYRHRLISIKGFSDEYDRITDTMTVFETAILKMVSDGVLGLDVRCYPSEADEVIKQHIENSRLSIKLLAVAMLIDLYRAKVGLLQIHAHHAYVRAFAAISDAYPELTKIGTRSENAASIVIFGRDSKYSLDIECGFKFTPLTEREVTQPMDVNFSAWRELYARRLASDLVLNAISPTFSLENQWTFIDGVDQTLFENPSMHRRYNLGEVAAQAVTHIRQARAELSQKQLPETDGTFSALDAHIYESIEYAQSFMLMSKVAMCSTMEHAGSTIATLPGQYARHKLTPLHESTIVKSCDHFAKICFDVLYGVHCLHTKINLVHGDLHGNNMTLHRFANAYKHTASPTGVSSRAIVPGPVVAYIAGPRGESDTYVFPYTGMVGTVIDFSRSIYGPGMAARLVKDFGQPFATSFYRDQVTRAIRIFHRYAPSFTEKHQEQLKAALLANFDSAFRVLSFVDFLAVGGAMVYMLEKYVAHPSDVRKFIPHPGLAVFARKIEQVSRDRLVTYLHELVDKPTAKSAAIPYAGEILLPELFPMFKYGAWENLTYGLDGPFEAKRKAAEGKKSADSKKSAMGGSADTATAASATAATSTPATAATAATSAPTRIAPELIINGADVSSTSPARSTLCDLYNINSPYRWSGLDYDDFPPWARADVVEAHAAGLKFSDIIARGSAPFLAVASTKDRRVASIAERMRAEMDSLDRPAGATSSWL